MKTEKIHAATLAAIRASERFEVWAGIGAGQLPPDQIDAVQVRLTRWQQAAYPTTTSDLGFGLGIIEELGETFDAVDNVDEAIDGLGDVMVYAAQLCTSNRLAFSAVIDLAEAWYRDPGIISGTAQPDSAAGRLAHVLLKRHQRIRGMADDGAFREALVQALAVVLVRAADSVLINHSILGGWDAINPRFVFVTVAEHVMHRNLVEGAPSESDQVRALLEAATAEGRLIVDDGAGGRRLETDEEFLARLSLGGGKGGGGPFEPRGVATGVPVLLVDVGDPVELVAADADSGPVPGATVTTIEVHGTDPDLWGRAGLGRSPVGEAAGGRERAVNGASFVGPLLGVLYLLISALVAVTWSGRFGPRGLFLCIAWGPLLLLALAIWIRDRIRRGPGIKRMRSRDLDRWGVVFDVPRVSGESDNAFRERLRRTLAGRVR